MTLKERLLNNIIKNNLYNFFESTQHLNWLTAEKAQKFFFKADLASPNWAPRHFSITSLKPALTPAFSNYQVFMTHSPTDGSIVLANLHSVMHGKGMSRLSLVPNSSIEFGSGYDVFLSSLPVVMGLAREGILLGSDMYTTSTVSLHTPLSNYISADMLPLSEGYNTFCTSLLADLNQINYPSKQIQDDYNRLEESLGWVAYLHKNKVYSSEVSVDLVYNQFISN